MQGNSAVSAGIKSMPFLIAMVISSMLSGVLVTVIGYYNPVIIVSTALLTLGAGLITTFWINTPISKWFGYQVVMGLGTGICFQAPILVVQNVLPQELIPQATACVQFFQSLGGAVFMAVSQTVFQNGLINNLVRDVPDIDPKTILQSGASQVRKLVEQMGFENSVEAVLKAYTLGLRNTYYISVTAAGCAFLVSLALQWKKLQKPGAGPKEEEVESSTEKAEKAPDQSI